MTLRLKTILAIAAVEILVLSALGYSTLSAMEKTVNQEFLGRTQATQQLMQGVATESLISFDLARLDSVVNQVVQDSDIDYVGVSTNGQWLSFAGNIIEPDTQPSDSLSSVQNSIFHTVLPISEGGMAFGSIHVGFDVTAIQTQLADVRARFAVIAAGGLLLSALLSYVLGTWLSVRAARLNRAAERLGQGDFNAVMVDSGSDEFSMLSRSFNHMAERLRSEAKQRESALQQAQKNEMALLQRSEDVERYNQLSNLLNVVQLNVILNPSQHIFSPALADDLLNLTDSEVCFIASLDGDQSETILPVQAWAHVSQTDTVKQAISNHPGFVHWESLEADDVGFDSIGLLSSDVRTVGRVLGSIELAEQFKHAAFLPIIQKGAVTGVFGFLRNSSPYNETLENFIQPLLTTCAQLADASKNNQARLFAEQELKASEETIRSVLESANDAIMTLTESGVVASANRAAGKVFGIPAEDLVGLWFGELLGSELRTQITLEGLGVLIPDNPDEVLNLDARRLSGGSVPIEMSLSPMSGKDENLYTAVVRDVTEKIQAQAALEQYSNQLDSILSLSGDGFIAFDAQGQVGYANPAFEKLLGLDGSSMRRHGMGTLSKRLMNQSENWNIPLSELNDGQSYRIKLLKPAQRYIHVTARKMLGDNNVVLGTVMYFQDVTHQTEVDRMKSEFLSTAAHELRTPLASVYGFSELLMSIDYDKETRDDLLETIHKQASRLTKLIDELLDLARIEARAGKDFDIKPGDLTTFLRELTGGFMVQNDDRVLQVELPEQLPTVAFDEDKLAQAVNNILTNAYKYSPQGGEITLSAIQVGNQVGIQVQDQGLGMTHEAVSRIYDRFYRADPSCNIPGTGLGMSVVKEIIEIHGGQIDIESELGLGTLVTLWLPEEQALAVG